MSPSAVSHHIQQLEAFLGVQLFQRHAGRASLTNAGRTYAKEIERAFGIIFGATNLVAPQSQCGHLVIASGPSFAAKWLQPRIHEFLGSHPDVKIRLSTLSERDDLGSCRFDIAIAYGRPSQTQMNVEPLLVERLRPLCSPSVAAALNLRRPRDLAQATLIHSANALTWMDYLTRVGEAGLRPANELWLDRSTMAIEAAVSGLGVVLESEILAAEELRQGKLVAPFSGQAFSVQAASYFLVTPRGYRSGSQVGDFDRWLRAAVLKDNLHQQSLIVPTAQTDSEPEGGCNSECHA